MITQQIKINVSISGAEDIYSNSFISPNSAYGEDVMDDLSTGTKTSAPGDIKTTKDSLLTSTITSQIVTSRTIENRVERSAVADPILSRTSGLEGLLAFKNVEDSFDSNDVELSGRYNVIQPSKTV